MAKHPALQVAEYFLASVDPEVGDNISNLKLQKLLYYAQGFHLALSGGEPLFDDQIEAWAHGPVVPPLYHRYKQYGAGAIPSPDSFDESQFDEETTSILDEVWTVYGQFSAWKLRDMTHAEPPWEDTPSNGTISLESMREYFQTLITR